MNEKEVDRQVRQMCDFIMQEAKEKANEIMIKATEEFNIEKLRLVELEKVKIRQEFERKEKSVDIQKKIQYSNEVNQSRLKVLSSREEVVSSIKSDVRRQLNTLAGNQAQYKDLCRDLLIQSMYRLMEDKVVVRCREADASLVQACFSDAQAAYQKGFGKPCTLTMSKDFLPPAPDKVPEGAKSCCGGVILATPDGKISVDNTLDAREVIVFEQLLPAIKIGLFGASASRTHVD